MSTLGEPIDVGPSLTLHKLLRTQIKIATLTRSEGVAGWRGRGGGGVPKDIETAITADALKM